jgi:tetratricopeptide (TPR) repeat protein
MVMEYNRRFNDSDPCWLIKVDAHISGPFSFNELIAKLMTGTISPHNEAMSPLDRWRPLQTQALFVAAIEKMRRKQEEVIENTMTRTEGTVTRTMDLTPDRQTQTPFSDAITPPPQAPFPNTSSSRLQRPYTDSLQKPTSVERIPVQWMYAVGLLILALLAGWYMLNRPHQPLQIADKKSDFVTYFDQGLSFKKTAHWSDALKNFTLAHQLNPRDVDLALEMAPLLIQLEGQTAYARSLIEKALVGQYKKETIIFGQNLLGLSYSYELQQRESAYAGALKHFNESLQIDAENEYVPALINKGWLLFTQGRFREGEGVLIKSISKNPYSHIGALYLIEGYLLQNVKENSKSALEKAQQLTAQLVSHKVYDSQQEVLLFHAYLMSKLGGDKNSVQKHIQNALSLDPDMTADHVHSPLIDWRGFQWRSFEFVCQDLIKLANNENAPLLNFICKYKGQGVLAAQQSIDVWLGKNPKDARAHIASAVVSQSVGELEKAKESLTNAKKLGANDRLYFQVLFKVCLKLKDISCLQEITPSLLKLSPLHGYTAQAMIDGDSQALSKGLKESANYIPLLSLQK